MNTNWSAGLVAVSQNDLLKSIPKDSWLRRWLEIWPTAESPKSYILFSGMAMLGAALGRNVWFNQDHRQLLPMLNLLLIGPSGIGKSTAAADLAFQCIETLPRAEQPMIVAGTPTVEKLHEDLLASPHAILFASELANFFSRKKYLEDLIPYVTELLDYRYVERRTKGMGLVRIDKPSVVVVGCSTKEWLQDQLPDTAMAGGFLPRFLIVNEETRSHREPLPGKRFTPSVRERLERKRQEVLYEFADIASLHKGEMDFADYAQSNVYSSWAHCYQPRSGHLTPFAQRAPEFALRLSMLVALTCGRKEILGEDVECATAMYEYCLGKLDEVVVPTTITGKMLASVLEAIGQLELTDEQLCRAMRNAMTAQDVMKYIISLQASGDVIRTSEGKWKRKRQG